MAEELSNKEQDDVDKGRYNELADLFKRMIEIERDRHDGMDSYDLFLRVEMARFVKELRTHIK